MLCGMPCDANGTHTDTAGVVWGCILLCHREGDDLLVPVGEVGRQACMMIKDSALACSVCQHL